MEGGFKGVGGVRGEVMLVYGDVGGSGWVKGK